MSLLPAAILKHSYVHARWVVGAKASGQLYWAVDHVVVANESTDKPDDNDRRTVGGGLVCLLRAAKQQGDWSILRASQKAQKHKGKR
jgi:hypothetical protein